MLNRNKPKVEAPTIGPEPDRQGPDGFLAAEWKRWEEATARARHEARLNKDPMWLARQQTPDEIARLAQAEADVKQAQDALDGIVNGQLAKTPRYEDGSAPQAGLFLVASHALTDATANLEAAIGRRGRVREDVDIAQTRRFDAARKAAPR